LHSSHACACEKYSCPDWYRVSARAFAVVFILAICLILQQPAAVFFFIRLAEIIPRSSSFLVQSFTTKSSCVFSEGLSGLALFGLRFAFVLMVDWDHKHPLLHVEMHVEHVRGAGEK